jgi:hypothetical protein
MRRHCYSRPTLFANEVHDQAAGVVQRFIHIDDHGPTCTARVLISVLFFAAACQKTINYACKRLSRAPTSQAARIALLATLPESQRLELRFNEAFASQVPKTARKRSRPIAIDLTLIPYYGEPKTDKRELRGGEAKRGTTQFHAYATAYMVSHGERFTLAMSYVLRDEPLEDVVRRLVERVRKIGVRIRYLLLDREFFRRSVACYLTSAHCAFLMPVMRRGRRPKDPAKSKGVWKFFAWKKSGWSTYLMEPDRRSLRSGDAAKANVTICVACVNHAGRKGRHGRRALVYACWGLRLSCSTDWVRQTYRKRFGIETSYRQMNQGRARTCSRDPVFRLLLVGIALLLRNVWVWFHLVRFAHRTRGGRLQLHLELLDLATLLFCLQRRAQALLGCTVPLNAPFPLTE